MWGFKETHKYSRRIGVNLYGLPGTGKTMAAHAIAKNLGRKILVVNYADIESKFVGETPKNIRKVFEVAKSTDSILFFDEADAILSKRVTNMTQAVDVSVNQTRSVMLMLMNEFQDFIIFATNFISNFDPAFMRRISIHIKFELPDFECRKKLWAMYIPKMLPNNIDIDEISKKFDGISGSDISNAMLNAAFKAARLKSDFLDKKLVFEAIYRRYFFMIPVLIGLGAIVGGFMVYENWDQITNWLKEFMPKIQEALKSSGVTEYAEKLFSSVSDGALKLVHRLYYKENGKWIEKTTTREIDESQVPEWAKAGLREKEIDVTERYQKELELTL